MIVQQSASLFIPKNDCLFLFFILRVCLALRMQIVVGLPHLFARQALRLFSNIVSW